MSLEQRKKIRALERELGVELLIAPTYRPAKLSPKQYERLKALEEEMSVRLVANEPASTSPRRRAG